MSASLVDFRIELIVSDPFLLLQANIFAYRGVIPITIYVRCIIPLLAENGSEDLEFIQKEKLSLLYNLS